VEHFQHRFMVIRSKNDFKSMPGARRGRIHDGLSSALAIWTTQSSG